ncbi:MAG TPA: Gmad2 immunoglobulin-like domain-containing protein [Candidatus Paceibacterota bacterium]
MPSQLKLTIGVFVLIIAGVLWLVTAYKPVAELYTYKDLVKLERPEPNALIGSPLVVEGEARGNWYFEASFPIYLTNWDGLIIATGVAQAKEDWMTTDYVPFSAKLEFTLEQTAPYDRGTLILRKDNPSGLPEHDDAFEIPVLFK